MIDDMLTAGDISSRATPTTPGSSFARSTQLIGAPINRIITHGA